LSRIKNPTEFILGNTRLQAVSHTPEIQLWLADEITPIWRLTEEELDEMGVPPPFWAFAWAGGQALARWLLDHPEECAGKTVVDLATGSGLVAGDENRRDFGAGRGHRSLLRGRRGS